MSIFTIADLHLSFSCDKPMDVFPGWNDYEERIKENWQSIVKPDDVVVIGGDISWASSLEVAFSDFEFIHSLNGKKIILKGNHDYWWSTFAKMTSFFIQKEFTDISILHNNAYLELGVSICGTRGWMIDSGEKDDKIRSREAGRLERSIVQGIELGGEPIVFLHYPPVYCDTVSDNIIEVLHRYDIKKCYFGHLHGQNIISGKQPFKNDGIEYRLISCDAVDFCPVLVKK